MARKVFINTWQTSIFLCHSSQNAVSTECTTRFFFSVTIPTPTTSCSWWGAPRKSWRETWWKSSCLVSAELYISLDMPPCPLDANVYQQSSYLWCMDQWKIRRRDFVATGFCMLLFWSHNLPISHSGKVDAHPSFNAAPGVKTGVALLRKRWSYRVWHR